MNPHLRALSDRRSPRLLLTYALFAVIYKSWAGALVESHQPHYYHRRSVFTDFCSHTLFPLALYLSYTCLFTLPQPLQYHCSALPGILYDLSGSHLDMAQGIIFPGFSGCPPKLKILADYRFRHRHHLLPEVQRADKSTNPYSLPMS